MSELAENIRNNPPVADIFVRLVAEAERCGLGHDAAANYQSQGGSMYLHVGRKDAHGCWNDEACFRISNHGARSFSARRELHLTLVQEPAALQANIETAIAAMSEISAGTFVPFGDRR